MTTDPFWISGSTTQVQTTKNIHEKTKTRHRKGSRLENLGNEDRRTREKMLAKKIRKVWRQRKENKILVIGKC